jgi:hypothetical protein
MLVGISVGVAVKDLLTGAGQQKSLLSTKTKRILTPRRLSLLLAVGGHRSQWVQDSLQPEGQAVAGRVTGKTALMTRHQESTHRLVVREERGQVPTAKTDLAL